MAGENYFIGVHAREIERLRDQHAAWEPETRGLWDRAGFGAGQHLADLGCGPGFSALDLAQRVGPAGRITAVDKAAPFLGFLAAEAQRQGLANVHTVEADFIAHPPVEGSLDGAFSRFFLAFLIDDLDRVLERIRSSLRPGGVLAAMEYLTLGSTTCVPPIRGFDAHTRAWVQYYRIHGGDTSVGSYLPERLTRAGFNVTYTGCVGGMAHPGERWWHWWGRLIEDFGDKLTAEALMTPDELRDLKNDWNQMAGRPYAFIHTPILIQLLAQRPT